MVAANGNGYHNPENNGNPLGDYGGGVSAKRANMETARLLQKALASGWKIPDDKKAAIVEQQIAIATSPSSTPRERTSAARCLAAMEGQSQAAIFKLLDKAQPDKVDVTHSQAQVYLPSNSR